MKRVMSVVGTRPEAIKMAPVIHALQQHEQFESIVCATSQHRTMQDQMLKLFDIQPDCDLSVMQANQDLFHITSAVLTGFKKILQQYRPDIVLTQGDTTTSFAASLAAFYCGIPIGHIEAGLRTHDLLAPFPEEANRQLTARLARWHFAPTSQARQNLINEAIPASSITVTGNTVIDALLWVRERIQHQDLSDAFNPVIRDIIKNQEPYILITGHRRENFGDGFQNICKAIAQLAHCYPKWHFIYPVHLNPNVQQPVYSILKPLSNVHLIDPLEYEPFVLLLDHCRLVLTDSGGVQEEAPSLGKPVLVMRDVTERPEGIEAGTAQLVGTRIDIIVETVARLITDKTYYKKMAQAVNPYGDGHAAAYIMNVLEY